MAGRKTILIFIDWYLPGFKAGGPVRSCVNLVDHLRDQFDFRIVTRDTDYCENIPYENIKSDEWNVLADGTHVFYFSKGKLNSTNIRRIISSTEFDTVYLNGIFSFYFTLVPLYFLRYKSKKVILASRGMFAPGALAIKKFKKKLFLATARLTGLFSGVIFQASSETERGEIKKHVPGAIVKVIPNLPKKIIFSTNQRTGKKEGVLRMVNVARISPEKNLLFALEILKEVTTKVEFDFYGPIYSKGYWEQCQKLLALLPGNITANYKGSIEPDKIREVFLHSDIMFMPTLGENFGHIIFESLSAGCPVIISDKTIWRALEAKNAGWDIPLSDKQKYISVIEKCSEMKTGEYERFSQGASALAESFSSGKELVQKSIELFL